ncbi:MAG: hypothetical protein ACLQNG_17605 [Acidimicrobiales bacterium]|jgi:hypothetical protein
MSTNAARSRLLRLSRGRITAAAALAALALAAAACSSSSSPTTTTTVASGSSTTTAAAAGGSSTTSTTSGSGGATSLSELESKLAAGQNATFVATYSLSGTNDGQSTNGTFTVAHSGTSSLFSVDETKGSFEEIATSSATDVCTKSASTWTCFTGPEASTLGSTISAFSDVYGSKAALALVQAHLAQAGATSSSSTVGGQPVTCWTWKDTTTGSAGTYTVCVTSSGVFAQEKSTTSTGTNTVTLQSYSTSVPASEFTPPATPTTTPT